MLWPTTGRSQILAIAAITLVLHYSLYTWNSASHTQHHVTLHHQNPSTTTTPVTVVVTPPVVPSESSTDDVSEPSSKPPNESEPDIVPIASASSSDEESLSSDDGPKRPAGVDKDGQFHYIPGMTKDEPQRTKVAIIVESRAISRVPRVIKQFMSVLGEDWTFQAWHGMLVVFPVTQPSSDMDVRMYG
jgi:hypothetical protein